MRHDTGELEVACAVNFAQKLDGTLGQDAKAAHPCVHIQVNPRNAPLSTRRSLQRAAAIHRVQTDVNVVVQARNDLFIHDRAKHQNR